MDAAHSPLPAAIASDTVVTVADAQHLHRVARAARSAGHVARVHLRFAVADADGCPREDWAALCDQAVQHEAARDVRVVGITGLRPQAQGADLSQGIRGRLLFQNAVRVAHRRGLTPRLLDLPTN